MALKIISLAIVIQRTGLSRSTIWRLERRQEFVPKVQLTPGRIGYLEHLVEQWISNKSKQSVAITEMNAPTAKTILAVGRQGNSNGENGRGSRGNF